MLNDLILTIISDDKPGVIDAVASTVREHEGNWLESRLTQLAGKFAGVVRIQIEGERAQALSTGLRQLRETGINIILESCDADSEGEIGTEAGFHAVGPDTPGIVQELTHTFSTRHINVIELSTKYSSMPYSGEPLFEAEGKINVPKDVQIHDIQEQLEEIANLLAIDISLEVLP